MGHALTSGLFSLYVLSIPGRSRGASTDKGGTLKINFRDYFEPWVKDGRVGRPVQELFALLGRPISSQDLWQVLAETQPWRRPANVRHDAMRKIAVRDVRTLRALLKELRMHDALPEHEPCFAAGVVLGGTLQKMRHRLAALTTQQIQCRRLYVLASNRPLQPEEKDAFRDLGVRPGKTEADAASFLLATTDHPKGQSLEVVTAPNRADGSPADTYETVVHFLQSAAAEGPALYVSHQPNGLRQILTARRAFLFAKRKPESVHFTLNSFGQPLETMTGVIFDEACRVLYELSHLSI